MKNLEKGKVGLWSLSYIIEYGLKGSEGLVEEFWELDGWSSVVINFH